MFLKYFTQRATNVKSNDKNRVPIYISNILCENMFPLSVGFYTS